MLKPLHFVERLCVNDVGDVEPFYLPQGSLIVVEPRRKKPTKSYPGKVRGISSLWDYWSAVRSVPGWEISSSDDAVWLIMK